MKYFKTTAILIAVCVILGCATEGKAKTHNASYEADIEYILTKYHILGEYEEVIRLLNKYHSNHKNELAYLYGLCYLKLNMNKIAIDYFNIVLEEHENNYEVLNNIGVAYFKDGDYANAMKYFHLSFISNADYEIARENYNTAYESYISKRENELLRPIIPFTEMPTVYNSLGLFYYYSGDFHNAIYYLEKSIEEDAKYQFSYIALAYVYIEGNNFQTALNYLKEAEKINETNPDLYNNMGIVYYHLSDYENSEKSLKKAISLNNRFAEPYNNLGFLYLETGKSELCEEYFLKSLEINLDNRSLMAESTAGLAVINMVNGNIEQAKAYKEASIKLDYKMNQIRYLTNNLKWSRGVLVIWSEI